MAERSGETERRKRRRVRRKFLLGENVEVLSYEEGLKGSWHAGVVIGCTDCSQVIEYRYLWTEDESSKLTDIIPVSGIIQDSGTRNPNNGRCLIRPLPPNYDVQINEIRYGLCVDAFVNEAWWEGVVFDHEEGSRNRLIFFPDQGDQQMVSVNLLRLTQDWDGSSDHWKPRGNWLFLQALQPFVDGDVLPVSIRDFWYQLSIMASFQEKIELWMLGSLPVWDSLVTGLYRELLSVVHGLSDICYEEEESFNAPTALVIPRHEKDRRSRTTQTSWQTLNIEAELCPEAINLYVSGSSNFRTHHKKVEIVEKVKKHLLASGWKIEVCPRFDGYLRFRVISPEGKLYYTLRNACIDLSKRKLKEEQSCNSIESDLCFSTFNSNNGYNTTIHPESALCPPIKMNNGTSNYSICLLRSSQSNIDAKIPKKWHRPFSKLSDDSNNLDAGTIEPNSLEYSEGEHQSNSTVQEEGSFELNVTKSSHIYKHMEPGYYPQAILTFISYMESSREESNEKIPKRNIELMKINAYKHLLYMGWRLAERRSKLQFVAPDGVAFHSLHSACKAYLDKKDLENAIRSSLRDSEFSQNTCFYKHHSSSSWKLKKIHSEAASSKDDEPDSSDLLSEQDLRERCQQLSVISVTEEVEKENLSMLIDNGIVSTKQKVRYVSEMDDHVVIEGCITRNGIRCSCCGKLHTISGFEAHAGCIECRPGSKTFLLDGRSLLRCQLQLMYGTDPIKFLHPRLKQAWNLSQSDSICSVCHEGGTLILCDHCPSAFHVACVGLVDVPEGEWFCPSCRCGICGLSEFSPAQDFTDKTMLYCDQCECEYHVGCLKTKGMTLRSCPTRNWFCSKRCSKIFIRLRNILGKSNPTEKKGLSWTILRCKIETDPDFTKHEYATVAWRQSKLHDAHKLLHQCFVTIIEPRTRSDLLSDLIMNKESELNRLNFWGFYTMLLERGDEIITVATFRVYGKKIAEMPLIGTSAKYRRQGMCHILLYELEKLLSSLGVERLCIPAVPSLLNSWTGSFGFTKMSNSDRLNLLDYNLLSFQDTIMCHKFLRATP